MNNKRSTDNGNICNESVSGDSVWKTRDSTQTPTPQKSNITSDESKNFEINVYGNHKITICKPLIPLKLTQFMYYGAGSFMSSFMTVLYKQRGVSLSQLSTMTITAPFVQFLGTTISGVAADKLGRAKPVFLVNLVITMSVLCGILILPKINSTNRELKFINLTCHESDEKEVKAFTSCEAIKESIEMESCQGFCKNMLNDQCSTNNINCKNFDYSKESNTSFTVYVNGTFLQIRNDTCQYNVTSIPKGNLSYFWCSNYENKFCDLSCSWYSETTIAKSSWILVAYFVFYVLYLTSYSNCYRCLDVTCMFLVKEHNSNFGHERFFAMVGNVLISPLAGYIANITTLPGEEKNYAAGVYLNIAMNILLLPILYKLQVRVKPPGEKMWKKALTLLRNPDVVTYFMLILVLGTAWNFVKYFLFWFLDGLNASSVLVGLITSVSALYGLPFLLTSHWWVKNIGSTRIFILALLAYSVNSAGYSFLQNPWLSLLLESTGIVSYYLLWVAVMEHSHDIAPEGLTATIIAVSGALHFSVGKVASGLMGKFIMNHFGARAAFRFSAVMTLIAAILYAFYLFVRNYCIQKNHKLKTTEELNGKMKEIYTIKIKDES